MMLVKCELSGLIDKFPKEAKLPTELSVRPLVGDYMESKCGNNILQVLSVTHTTIRVGTRDSSGFSYEDVPGLKLYLGR